MTIRYDSLSFSLYLAPFLGEEEKRKAHSDARIHRHDKFLGFSLAPFLSALIFLLSLRSLPSNRLRLINGINKRIYRRCALITRRNIGFVINS